MATASSQPISGIAFDAIVLAGGSARRLGGVDKATISIGGARLLDRVLDALGGAQKTIVVGPRREVPYAVCWVQEKPAGRGPVPAIAAGLDQLTCSVVAILAVDLPFVTRHTIERLLGALRDHDAAILIDEGDRLQPLCGVYRSEALATSLRAATSTRLMDVVQRLDVATLSDPLGARDCDDWAAVEAARARVQTDGSLHTSTTTSRPAPSSDRSRPKRATP